MSGNDLANLIYYGGSPDKRDKERLRQRKLYEDPEYRAKKLAEAKRRYREKTKKAKKKKTASKQRGRNKPRPWVLPDGKVITLIGLGQAADICGLNKRTLARYEDKGVIPRNRLMDDNGRRWYPKAFVEFLAQVLAGQSEKREPLWSLKRRVERAWETAREQIPVLKEPTEDDRSN